MARGDSSFADGITDDFLSINPNSDTQAWAQLRRAILAGQTGDELTHLMQITRVATPGAAARKGRLFAMETQFIPEQNLKTDFEKQIAGMSRNGKSLVYKELFTISLLGAGREEVRSAFIGFQKLTHRLRGMVPGGRGQNADEGEEFGGG